MNTARVSSAGSNSLCLQHGHQCVKEKGQRSMKKRSKEVKAEKYLISVRWGFSLSISAGFLPKDYVACQKTRHHFSVSPAVLLWHVGTAGMLGYLLARHVRGDPIGSPS